MKKLFLLSCAIFLTAGSVKSQMVVSTPTFVVTDTLHYYFNKFHFKTGLQMKDFPFYKGPSATGTNITHVGNKFENCDTLQILGLQAFATNDANSGHKQYDVRLFLCGLDNNGKPLLPPIDSVLYSIGGSQIPTGAIGGPFPNGRIRKVTGNFAVLIRNFSLAEGDTLRLFRTAAKTFTSNAAWSEKYSDGYGYVRWNGNFYSTTDYTMSPGFGPGTDYEFLVAPIVRYNLWAAHELPKKIVEQDPICTFEHVSFTNKSAKLWTHRMYNLNSFYVKWRYYGPPFMAVPQSGAFSSDSAITWFFEPNQGGPMGYVYLPACNSCNICPNNKGTFYTARAFKSLLDGQVDSVACFPDCQFRARFTSMAIYGRGQKFNTMQPNGDSLKFKVCTIFCNNDNVGITSEGRLNDVRLYPNPSANGEGMVTISGLHGENNISIYSMTGQVIQVETTDKEKVQLNIQKHPPGNFIIRVTNTGTYQSKVFKVIRN